MNSPVLKELAHHEELQTQVSRPEVSHHDVDLGLVPCVGRPDVILQTIGQMDCADKHRGMAYIDDRDKDGDVFSTSNVFADTGHLLDPRHEPRPRKSRFKGFMAALMYGTFSAGMAFANKAILSFYHFNFSYFLMFCQMMFTIIALESMRNLGLIKLPRYTFERGRTLLIPSMLYAIYSVLALSSLARMNIAMYDVIKRCGPLATLLVSWLVLKTDRPTTSVSASVIMITLGCIIAGYGDLTFDLTAYTHGAVSDFAQALSLVMIQRITDTKCMSAIETLHLNSVNAVPLLFICSAISGEFGRAGQQFSRQDLKFMFIFFIVISSGCLLNFFLFLCTALNSALTTSVVGTVKSIVQTVVGTWTFGGFSVNIFTITGVSINLFGTLLYSFAKWIETMRRRRVSSNKEGAHDI